MKKIILLFLTLAIPFSFNSKEKVEQWDYYEIQNEGLKSYFFH